MKKQIALSNIVDTKAEVFCVSLALFLLDAANEAYYDASKKFSTTSVQLITSSDSSISNPSWENTAKERKWADRPTVSRGSTEDRSGDSQSSSSSGEPGTSEEPSLQSGSYGAANWEKYGYEIIDQKYHAYHDTYVYIGRHIESDKIIVAFR